MGPLVQNSNAILFIINLLLFASHMQSPSVCPGRRSRTQSNPQVHSQEVQQYDLERGGGLGTTRVTQPSHTNIDAHRVASAINTWMHIAQHGSAIFMGG